MKLIHGAIDADLISEKPFSTILIVEQPKFLLEIIRELMAQLEGEEGRFSLSENNRSLDLARSVYFQPGALNLEHNPRKALTALYKQLTAHLAEDERVFKVQELLETLSGELNHLLPESFGELEPIETPDWASIFKFFDIRFRSSFNRMEEEVHEFMLRMKHYGQIKVFIFLNLGGFLESDALERLFRQAAYDEIVILLVESAWPEGKAYGPSRVLRIDSDLCEIILQS